MTTATDLSIEAIKGTLRFTPLHVEDPPVYFPQTDPSAELLCSELECLLDSMDRSELSVWERTLVERPLTDLTPSNVENYVDFLKSVIHRLAGDQ